MNARGISFGDASGTAGNDDAADAGEPVRRGIDGKEVTLSADLTNTPREQMTVLTTRIQNRNAFHGVNYNFLLRNAFIRACASADTRCFAMASTVR